MKVDSVKLAYFSPTGTTKKVVEGIAATIGAKNVEHINLTSPDTMSMESIEIKDGLVILGAPVYGGRIPTEAVERFRKLKGNGVPAVIVVVYGNRAYEDALVELRDIAIEQGFKPIAGGAFIGEHSFSSEDSPLAAGRPDTQDIAIAHDFGHRIAEDMKEIENTDNIHKLDVPGNTTLKERHEREKIPPATDESLCKKCMTCAEACPTASITINNKVNTNADSCILCCACVKICPTSARKMKSPMIDRIREWLSNTCKDRKEPELFLS